MKKIFGALVRWSGLSALLRFVHRRRVTIVVYHDPTPEGLRAHLSWYARRYAFTTLDAVADAMQSGRWDTLPRYPLVFTLDDGHVGNARLDAVFRAFDVRPTVYLCSRLVGTQRPFWWMTPAADRLDPEPLKRLPDAERRRCLAEAEAGNDLDQTSPAPRQALSWEEARQLGVTYDYGAHTRHHPILPQCDDHTAAEEIGLCKVELEDTLQRSCHHFAYPNGDFGEREVALLRAAGYRTARSIDPGWNGPQSDPFNLKAFPITDDAPLDWLTVQITGIPAWIRSMKTRVRPGAVKINSYP